MTASFVVTGSRSWTDVEVMNQALIKTYLYLGGSLEQRGGVTLISGHADGADKMAESIWYDKVGDLWISRWPANMFPNPLVRNDYMLGGGNSPLRPSLVLAFQMPCTKPSCPQRATYGVTHATHGTAYTVRKARAAGIETKVVQTLDSPPWEL